MLNLRSVSVYTHNPIYAIAKELEMHHQPKKLLDQIRDVMRVKHYSIRTACPELAEGNRPT
jgi:hypothetical protein